MRVDLNVPYAEKDAAKHLGVKWDGVKRTWFVQDVPNIAAFMRWMPEHLKKPQATVKRIKPEPERPNMKRSKWIRGMFFTEIECDCLPWIGCEKCKMQ